jgi:hypothetical protein
MKAIDGAEGTEGTEATEGTCEAGLVSLPSLPSLPPFRKSLLARRCDFDYSPAIRLGWGGVGGGHGERKRTRGMAAFQTHITISTLTGVGVAAAGYSYGIPPESCLLALGLCSVSGILPDLDSNSGIPYRESVAFISAFVPMLLISRFQHFGWDRETIILAAALIYIGIRFGIAEMFRRYTVHRGMWHSLPAAASVGLLAFLITDDRDLVLRCYWGGAAVAGFMSHLILDEIYSVNFRGVRLKKSFGTAVKLWSHRGLWPNVSTYGKLIILALLAWGDPMLMEWVEQREPVTLRAMRPTDQPLEAAREDLGETVDSLLR